MTKQCDNRSVGVLIADQAGRYLMFDRNTFPPGVAGAAGHVDEHGSFLDAARAEVSEELGLSVLSLTPVPLNWPVATPWRDNRCRRLPGPSGVGHRWHLYRAQTAGTLAPSARETRNVRWLTTVQLQALAERTAAYAHGHLTDAAFAELPGIEPVWVAWLMAAGLVTVPLDDLARIDQLAADGALSGAACSRMEDR
ncbi:NUDIX hydrolase [Streptosporangium sp. NBC_01469]|uniref:NUDIX hydrolase n=1 Tax=Streptosporangium sp. NBC_01469 TaxID=2903898 RepID=UPI002E27F7BE|nr:NUDIX hydrolase [Streptosporangium sp. NBC_01469]